MKSMSLGFSEELLEEQIMLSQFQITTAPKPTSPLQQTPKPHSSRGNAHH